MTESKIEVNFCKRLTKLGYRCIKMGQDGWPDRMILGETGLVSFIEFKTAVGKVSKRQRECLDELAKRGFFVAVVTDCDEETVDEFLADWHNEE